MSPVHYSLIGVTACLAAIGGAFGNMSMRSGMPEHTGVLEAISPMQMKTPQLPIPIYSKSGRVGYCVIRASFEDSQPTPEERQVALPRITNKLFADFAARETENIDGPTFCAARVGEKFDTFTIIDAEFYEKFR